MRYYALFAPIKVFPYPKCIRSCFSSSQSLGIDVIIMKREHILEWAKIQVLRYAKPPMPVYHEHPVLCIIGTALRKMTSLLSQ